MKAADELRPPVYHGLEDELKRSAKVMDEGYHPVPQGTMRYA